MSDVFNFYVYDDRSIQFALAEPIMLEDKDVTQFRFRIPKSLNGFDMSDWEWWFIFVNPNGTKYTTLLELTDDEDEPDDYSVATYTVGYGFSGIVGTVRFSIEALNVSGEEIVNEWHTKTYGTAVIDTLQGLRAVIPEPEGQTIDSLISNLDARVTALEAGGSGLSQTEKNLILTLFSKAAYAESDASTAYNALEALWAVTTRTVTYNLSHVTSSNTASSVDGGSRYTTTLTATESYSINSVTVTMGGVDVTATYYNSGTITIPSVTGNIVITATAVLEVSSLSAVYTQSGTVYDTDSLDSLKNDLVVTATYPDSSTAVIDSADYTLSGTLTIGTSAVTVSYGGKTATFEVTVTKGLDYTENALEGVTWLDGYTYNAGTGALEVAEGEHCSEKFTAQELIHKITIGSSNQYPRLFVWDTNDNYLGYVQHDTTVPSNWMLMPEYKYALKVYDTDSFDSSVITCIPVDNRETAVPAFELKLTDYLDSMKKSGANYEFPCNTIMQSFGVSASNWNNAINRVDKLTNIQYNGYSLGQKCPFSLPFKMCFYQNSAFVFNTTPAQSSLDAMKEYITTNDVRIKFNY